ncbi:MAG TPA: GntR family transcriptional regulator [Burkholderiales bacterium]|nr:GntR family transcriptional regulator [Burkholderiales bacterium]
MKKRQDQVIYKLRGMILQGELPPGQRLAEIPLASRLGVSRTPIRRALAMLAQEGLVTESESRGYLVREFSLQEVLDAIDLRGVLEGHAARLVAERGASRGLIRELTHCLERGDALFRKQELGRGDELRYAEMNERFHKLIADAAGHMPLSRALSLNDRVPFASAEAAAFASEKSSMKDSFDLLKYAHRQHHYIVQALERGEGARVEALMREHTMPVKEHVQLVMASAGSLNFLKDAKRADVGST